MERILTVDREPREVGGTGLSDLATSLLPPKFGADVRDALPQLLRALVPLESTVEFYVIRTPHRAQTRLKFSEPAKPLIESARLNRKLYGTPFWDALLAETLKTGPGFPREVVDNALFHQRTASAGKLFRMSPRDITRHALDEILETLTEREILVVRSRLLGSHEGLHLPMLDLHVSSDIDGAATVAASLLSSLGVPGLLFESGRSYHFYGQQLLSHGAMLKFLARAQLLSPIVDVRWAAHQIIEGSAALRISAGRERQHYPRFISMVNAVKESQ